MQKCEITGKGKQFGHNVSFSQRHTKKVWKPNLQTKTLTVDGKKVTMKVSTQALRTLKKKGLIAQVRPNVNKNTPLMRGVFMFANKEYSMNGLPRLTEGPQLSLLI